MVKMDLVGETNLGKLPSIETVLKKLNSVQY